VARGDNAADVANVTLRNWTTVGTVGSPSRAIVDPRGLVTPQPDGWSLDWWIGAEDRWHFPSREAAVRQQLIGESPVVETSMRVPGGDAVQRVYGVPEDLVVVEVTNDTPTPIAVAFAIRPYNPIGVAPVSRIALDERTVRIDGHPALHFAKRPPRLATSTFTQGDAVERVLTEDLDTELLRDVRCDRGMATAAFLLPLAHRQTLRIAVSMTAGRPGPVDVDALPDRDAVVRSWHAQTANRGLRLVVPEGRLASAVEASRRSLLLAPPLREVDRAMADLGFDKDRSEVVASGSSEPSGGQGVDTLGSLRVAQDELAAGDDRALERLSWLLDAASPTWTWPSSVHPHLGTGSGGDGHDGRVTAAFLSLVRDLLVRETADAGLAVCSMLPEVWRGQPLEVHDAPTRVGRLSFAVRYHGDRPALLWDLKAEPGAASVRITAPGLDPGWSTTEHKGEALLAAATNPPADVAIPIEGSFS
jgi:hypothetical protein